MPDPRLERGLGKQQPCYSWSRSVLVWNAEVTGEEGRKVERSREKKRETPSDERLLRPARPLPGGRRAGRCAPGTGGRDAHPLLVPGAPPTRAHRSLSGKERQGWEGKGAEEERLRSLCAAG